jgi:UDP-2,4-diacetamido-2,4,6-trideoxy-beta-L-altropyranose hydrolase
VNTLSFRADATMHMGIGHVMRCVALAQSWQERGGKALFISHCESDALQKRISAEGFDLITLENPHPDPLDCNLTLATLKALNNEDSNQKAWLVVDGYHFDADYQKRVKDAGHKLLCIDDYGHAADYYADLILNQNISADELFYNHREPYVELLLGTRYALLRREFQSWRGWQRKIPTTARKVLVSLGGADPHNVTLKVIHALKQVDVPGMEVRIVSGPANPHLGALRVAIDRDPDIQLLTDITNMPEFIAWADIAVSAGGSTCWELAFMGLPNIVIVTADNQRGNAEALGTRQININLGWHQDISLEGIAEELEQLMMNAEQRSWMSERGQKLVDGDGGRRLSRIIADEALYLRPVLSEDCERVWKWANDPSIRAVSFSTAFISWEEHIRWFQERKNRPFFYMALDQDDIPVGQVRFDQTNAETIISVLIDGNYRNRGYGSAMIRMACEGFFFHTGVVAIHAYLKPGNAASRMAFIKAGFKEISETVFHDCPAYHFILTKN